MSSNMNTAAKVVDDMALESAQKVHETLATKDAPRQQKLQRRLVVEVKGDDGRVYHDDLPLDVEKVLLQVLAYSSQGRPVEVIAKNAELTTQQAATLLNVSRPYLIRLLERKEIPYHMVGTHRRIRYSDLLEYKQKLYSARRENLREMTRIAQELGEHDL